MKPTLSPMVASALERGGPVVALESALLTHGLPFPINLETARQAESAVKAAGAVPATIGIVAGQAVVGLGQAEMSALAEAGAFLLKASRRDLAWASVRRLSAGTTVGGTLALAHAAGIKVFATGGIGGVHQGAASTFDVSSDLVELGRTPVAVVATGFKIILDLPKTLEALETLAVPVVGWQCDELPGFYLRTSGLRLEQRVDSMEEAARLVRGHWQAGGQGLLLVQPPPRALDWQLEEMERVLAGLETEAQERGILGKAVTPFLLERLAQISQGATLAVNQELIVANAARAAELAVALAQAG